MGKKKRKKYSAAKTLTNIIQPDVIDHERFILADTWDPDYFNNPNPMIAEIGCGKGDYTINLARRHPELNFIGIDIKSDRMLHGATAALDEGLDNVCFVRIRMEFLASFFPKNFFSEGWITFPDPYASSSNGKRRLTSGRFIDIYRSVFKPGSRLHLKTDNEVLYDYTLESIRENQCELLEHTPDLYSRLNGSTNDPRAIRTTYEKRYLARGLTIKYVGFSL